jgi:hypothetical protein
MAVIQKQYVTVELDDGEVIGPVRIINADVIAYEATARKHGWAQTSVGRDGRADMGDVQQAITFKAWKALRRTGAYAGTFEQFATTDCVDISAESVDADPTSPAPGAGSLPNSPGPDTYPFPNSPTLMTT